MQVKKYEILSTKSQTNSNDQNQNHTNPSPLRTYVIIPPGHCTPRALPQDGYVILQGASDQRERGNLNFSTCYAIASVVLLTRNDIMTWPLRGAVWGERSFRTFDIRIWDL